MVLDSSRRVGRESLESFYVHGMAAPLNESRVRTFDVFNFVGDSMRVIKLAKAPVDANSDFDDKGEKKQRKKSEREEQLPTYGNVAAVAAD